MIFQDGRIVFANQAFASMSGYALHELLGRSLEDVQENIIAEDRALVWNRYQDRLKGKNVPDRYEFRALRKDGSVIWLEIYASRIEFQGKPSVQAAILDVTERKKAEEELKRYRAHLEELVAERTDELRREIAERKMAEEKIRTSLREKELLIKEVHHRVKNNLQVICSLLNLQSDYIKDDKAIEIFRESQNRVKSMAIIHEKLYKSKDLASIDFADYARALAADLFKSYRSTSGRVQLRMNVQDVFLGIDTAIPLGLIINELLSNALKHAFPEGRDGEIQIDLLRKGAGFELVVGDNGIGFPEDLDFRNTESLGLQLVVTLTDQLKGTIELDRTRGTEFRIAFSEID